MLSKMLAEIVNPLPDNNGNRQKRSRWHLDSKVILLLLRYLSSTAVGQYYYTCMWSCDWTITQHHFHFHSHHRSFLQRKCKRHVRYSRWFLWSERYFKTFLCTFFFNFERINSLLSWRDADTIDQNLSLVVCSLVSCLLKSFNGFQRRFVHIRHACVPGRTVAIRSTHYVYNSNQICFSQYAPPSAH